MPDQINSVFVWWHDTRFDRMRLTASFQTAKLNPLFSSLH